MATSRTASAISSPRSLTCPHLRTLPRKYPLHATEGARILVLSGTGPQEPVAVYGPFIMSNKEQLAQTFDRYQCGHMERLLPVDEQDTRGHEMTFASRLADQLLAAVAPSH